MELEPTETVIDLLIDIRDELRGLRSDLAEAKAPAKRKPAKSLKKSRARQDNETEPKYIPTEEDKAKALRLARELGFRKVG